MDDFIMSPKVDFAFKELMRNDFVRIGFLSAVLGIEDVSIKKTTLMNTNLPKQHENEKQGILDVRLTMNDNTEINIEIQLWYMSAWANRSVFYVARMITEQTEINKKYSNIKKCVGISILDFEYIRQCNKFHTVYHFREDAENLMYTDVMEIHVVELPKLPSLNDGTSLYDWVRFIKAETREEFEMLAKQSKYLEAAYDTLEKVSADEEKRHQYLRREVALYDQNTLMEENYERGKMVGKAIMLKALYKDGVTVEQLAEKFNLPVSEVVFLLQMETD